MWLFCLILFVLTIRLHYVYVYLRNIEIILPLSKYSVLKYWVVLRSNTNDWCLPPPVMSILVTKTTPSRLLSVSWIKRNHVNYIHLYLISQIKYLIFPHETKIMVSIFTITYRNITLQSTTVGSWALWAHSMKL